MLIAVVWHWWIAPLLAAGAVLAVLGTIVGYLKSVTSQRYPDRRQRAARKS